MLLVKAVTGPDKARVGQNVTYRVTSFSDSQATQDAANVHWLIKSEDGEALAHILGGGAVLEIVVPERWAHHTAIVMPYLRSPTTDIAARTAIAPGDFSALRANASKTVDVTRDDGRFYASVDREPRFYLGTQVRYSGRRGLMNWSNAPGPRYRPEDYEAIHGDWAWYLLPTITCESKGYFTCLNTYDRACFTFGHMQLGAHTPDDNFVLLMRRLLQQPLAAGYFPDLSLVDGRIHHNTDAGLIPLESASDTAGLMSYFNRTADAVDDEEADRAARMVDWCLRDPAARELQVTFTVGQQRRKLVAHAQTLPLDGLADKLCLVVLDILHQGRASYRLIAEALAASEPLDALLSLGASTYRDRVATLRAGIRDLEALGKVGQKVYNAQLGHFVVPAGA